MPTHILGFLAVAAVFCVAPGPDTVLVVNRALGPRTPLRAAHRHRKLLRTRRLGISRGRGRRRGLRNVGDRVHQTILPTS